MLPASFFLEVFALRVGWIDAAIPGERKLTQSSADASTDETQPVKRRSKGGRRSTRELRHLPALSVRSGFRWAGEIAFYVVIAGAPLPFGSDQPSSVALWCVLLGISCVLLAATTSHLTRLQTAILFAVGGLVALYALVLHEQLADHPWIAPYLPIWSQTAAILHLDIQPSASLVKGEPFFALGPTLANILALVCGLFVGAAEDGALRTLKVIGWSGVTYAVYGLFAFFAEPTKLLWREKQFYLGNLTGTFVNRNTAAAYFGSTALIWLCLLMRQARHHLGAKVGPWRTVPRRILDDPPKPAAVSFAAWFFCLAAMFLTASRAGVALSLFAMVVVVTIYFRADVPKRYGIGVFAAAAAAVALALLQFMGGVVSNRFDLQGLADEGRLAAYVSTLHMIADHPWFGTGLGTFQWAFPAYRSSAISMRGVWDIAHNTPLELAAEVGIPLAAVVALAWIAAFAVLAHGLRARGRHGLAALAALGMSLVAVLHSLVDFTLQIPGYSIPAIGLLGAALSGCGASKK